jgi:selenophosphate synthetase-related protein
MYPGMGFIVTCDPGNTGEVIRTYERHGLTAAKIGKVVPSARLDIIYGRDRATVFDLTRQCITGLARRKKINA